MAERLIKVYANKWLHVDHNGLPACVIPNQEMPGRWIGATRRTVIKNAPPQVTIGTLTSYLGDDPHEEVETTFTDEPEMVRECAFIRDMIRDGALVLDDPAEAERMGLKVATGKSALAPDPNAPASPTYAPKPATTQPARSKGQE